MKKILSIMTILILLGICGCNSEEYKNSEMLRQNKEENGKSVPVSDIYTHKSENFTDFKSWFISNDALKTENGAFQEVITPFMERGYILTPSISGKEADVFFVDSNIDFVNFIFTDPQVRLSMEVVKDEQNEFNTTNTIIQLMEKFYGIKFNDNKAVDEKVVLEKRNPEDLQYESRYLTIKELNIGGENKKCILDTTEINDIETEYILAFLEQEILIRAAFYDDEERKFDLKNFETLDFKKEHLD